MEIKITLTEFDYKVLQHQLISAEEWSQLALDGKINNVKKRLLREAQEALIADEEIDIIPATTEGLLELYFSRSYYKDRQQREVEEQSEE